MEQHPAGSNEDDFESASESGKSNFEWRRDFDWTERIAAIPQPKRRAAAQFLISYLHRSPGQTAPSSDIKEAAAQAGHTKSTLNVARKSLGVDVYSNTYQVPQYGRDDQVRRTTAWSLQIEPEITVLGKDYRLVQTYTKRPLVVRRGSTDSGHVQSAVPGRGQLRNEATDAIEAVACEVASRPWPGRSGPRDARVMATVLRSMHSKNALVIRIKLWDLADECGIGGWETVKAALYSLEQRHLIAFVLGEQHEYQMGQLAPSQFGRKSIIKLIKPTTTARFPTDRLPNAARDIFANDLTGHPGYLIAMRVLFVEHEKGGRLHLTHPEIRELTGLTESTEKRQVKRGVKAGLLDQSEDGKWFLKDPGRLTLSGDDGKMQDRKKKRIPPVLQARTTRADVSSPEGDARLEELRGQLRP